MEVIHLSSPKTLSTGKAVMTIAGPLIRVLGDRYGWNVKVATLKALVELVRKVSVARPTVLILMGQLSWFSLLLGRGLGRYEKVIWCTVVKYICLPVIGHLR